MAEYTETITTKILCPDCESPNVIEHGFQNGQQRYRYVLASYITKGMGAKYGIVVMEMAQEAAQKGPRLSSPTSWPPTMRPFPLFSPTPSTSRVTAYGPR